jgi:hypothetical protein
MPAPRMRDFTKGSWVGSAEVVVESCSMSAVEDGKVVETTRINNNIDLVHLMELDFEQPVILHFLCG